MTVRCNLSKGFLQAVMFRNILFLLCFIVETEILVSETVKNNFSELSLILKPNLITMIVCGTPVFELEISNVLLIT